MAITKTLEFTQDSVKAECTDCHSGSVNDFNQYTKGATITIAGDKVGVSHTCGRVYMKSGASAIVTVPMSLRSYLAKLTNGTLLRYDSAGSNLNGELSIKPSTTVQGVLSIAVTHADGEVHYLSQNVNITP